MALWVRQEAELIGRPNWLMPDDSMVLFWGQGTSAGFSCHLWCRNVQKNLICPPFTFLLFVFPITRHCSAKWIEVYWIFPLTFSQYSLTTASSALIRAVSLYKCPASHLLFVLKEFLRNMQWLSDSGLLLSHAEHGVLLFWEEGELETAEERKSLLKVPLSPGSSIHSTSVKLLLRF